MARLPSRDVAGMVDERVERAATPRVQADDGPADALGDSIEDLATSWLEAERTAVAVGNANNTEERARVASAAYDAAVAAASSEELLLAWRAAEAGAAASEMGSKAWAEAREVAELLRVEYLAARS